MPFLCDSSFFVFLIIFQLFEFISTTEKKRGRNFKTRRQALLDAEEARKPKPHPAGLDQKVAYRMLTQLGLEPDVPGGAVEVRQQDTPELFATLVAVGYKPKAYADGGAVVVPLRTPGNNFE